MATFKKGDRVTHFGDWDSKGTVSYRQCVVHSCGKKQMVLTDLATGEEAGRHFHPIAAEGTALGTRPALSNEQAETLCLTLGAEVLVQERARFADRLQRWPDDAGFVAAMHEGIAALHEPRAINWNSH